MPELVLRERVVLSESAFVEAIVWRLRRPAPGSEHRYKYRLALVSDGVCVLRYDNEAGKGDHKHVRERQIAYRFTDLETLQSDFWRDVEKWRKGK